MSAHVSIDGAGEQQQQQPAAHRMHGGSEEKLAAAEMRAAQVGEHARLCDEQPWLQRARNERMRANI